MMSRTMNLPQISKILQDFERESSAMDMKEEMMSDTVDDVMDEEGEDEEAESDKILKQVLDEIGVNMSQQVSCQHHVAFSATDHVSQLGETPSGLGVQPVAEQRQAVAVGEGGLGPSAPSGSTSGARDTEVDDLQARLDKLRRD